MPPFLSLCVHLGSNFLGQIVDEEISSLHEFPKQMLSRIASNILWYVDMFRLLLES